MSLQSFLRADGILVFLSKLTGPEGSPSVRSWKWALVSLREDGISVHFYCKLLCFAIQ